MIDPTGSQPITAPTSPRTRSAAAGRPRRVAACWPGLLAAITGLSLLAGCSSQPSGSNASSNAPAAVEIGIVQLISHPSLDAIREGFKQAFTDNGYVEGATVDFDEQNPQGDMAGLTSVANNFRSADKDLVFSITTTATQSVAQVITDKPIIFGGVTDPVTAKLVASWDHPGGNVTGTADYPQMDDQMSLIKELAPEVHTVGMVYASGEVNSQVQASLAKDAADRMGLTLQTATITNSSEVQQAATSLKGVDAFFVSNDNLVVAGLEGLLQIAEQQGVPVVVSDPDSVKRGAAAGYAIDQHKMGYNAGLMALKVLREGADPATIPVQKQTELVLSVNTAAAARQKAPIPDDLLAKATNRF